MFLRTACGHTIEVSKTCLAHLKAHSSVLPFLEEAAALIHLPKNENFYRQAICLGRVIGENNCVRTDVISPDTTNTFAIRTGREQPSRITINHRPAPCDSVSIIAVCNNSHWQLITAYIGLLAPREPHDQYFRDHPEELPESLRFWCCHALIYEVNWSNIFVSNWEDIINGI